MSVKNYARTVDYHQTRVTKDSDISALRLAAGEYINDPDAVWYVDGDTLVFETPMGEQLVSVTTAGSEEQEALHTND